MTVVEHRSYDFISKTADLEIPNTKAEIHRSKGFPSRGGGTIGSLCGRSVPGIADRLIDIDRQCIIPLILIIYSTVHEVHIHFTCR